jgi:NADH dehydrogenase
VPPAEASPHVVIVGGGFGGICAAKALRRAPVRVTLIDARNHHLFQPLLYQVATAGLNPSDISAPIRRILRRQTNAQVRLARAEAVDAPARELVLEDGERIPYDWLILATGATHSYFGNDAWQEHAPGLKTVEEALEIRRRVLFAFEAAEHTDDPAERDAWLTFAVVGGGATGVELAGALAELSRHTLIRDFRKIDPRTARILLIEGGDAILAPFGPQLSAKAERQLAGLGVTVRTGARVEAIDAQGLALRGGERIASRTVLWAAGVAGSPIARSLGAPLDRSGRVEVEPTLQVPGHERVFVIGDLAAVRQEDGSTVPGLAPAAMQGGTHAGKQIRRILKGKPPEPFRYKDKGTMATIGRRAGIADLGWLHLSGPLAWLAWLSVHIVFLIEFRNKALVLFQWVWAYLTFQRGARLITGSVEDLRQRSAAAAPGEAPGEEPQPEASGAEATPEA